MLQVRHNNLEEILSFCLASRDFDVGYPSRGETRYERLCRILQNVYRRFDLKNWLENDGWRGSFCSILGLHDGDSIPSQDLTFITTNYDVMIEYVVGMLDQHCIFPCKWSAVQSAGGESRAGIMCADDHRGPLLCKLHGSLNWFVDDHGALQVENTILSGTYKQGGTRPQVVFPKVSYRQYETPGAPLIVPPTLFKMQTDPILGDVWRAAGRALQEAEKLAFVGFSFPESDIHIRYFLAADLSGNPDLGSIDVVGPNAGEICRRLRESNFGLHFTERLRPIVGEWQRIAYSVLG